jgi:hypothetical protein
MRFAEGIWYVYRYSEVVGDPDTPYGYGLKSSVTLQFWFG